GPRIRRRKPECPGVNHQKDQEPNTRQDHRGGGERLPTGPPGVPLLLVADRPCRLVAEEHPQRLIEVDEDDRQQSDLDGRKQRVLVFHHIRVLIEDVGTQKDQQIPADVYKKVEEKKKTSGANDKFGADSRTEDT